MPGFPRDIMMGTAMAKEYGGSFGNESLAKAEAAVEESRSTLRPGAILAGYQKPNRGDPREAELRVQAKVKQPTALEIARANEARRSALSADERKTQAATLSVAVAQPHRRISADPRHPMLESPLGRFCLRTWPKDSVQRHFCHQAGNDYAKDVRDYQRACGFDVPGLNSKPGAAGSGDVTPEAVAEAALAKEAAKALVDSANAVLIPVMQRLPRAMERLCCTLEDPYPNDESILEAGLLRLAKHYDLVD